MQDIQPELIEKYQLLLQKDPKSQVFAPLTEAYRKMGLLEEALRIATRGVQFNPNFGGGRIALAKVFLERKNLEGAIEHLEKAVDLSPDNILAHSLLGECQLKAKRPKEALRAFKMVLFLAPNNEKAITAVRKLESLTADEYEDDLFEMRPLPNIDDLNVEHMTPLRPSETSKSDMERSLSLADAYIVRGDIEKALATLKQAERGFGAHPELIKRLKLVNQRTADRGQDEAELQPPTSPPPSRKRQAIDRKIHLLEQLLENLQKKSQFT